MNSTATDLIGLEETQRKWLRDPSGFVFARIDDNTVKDQLQPVDYPPPLKLPLMDKSQRTPSSRLLDPTSWSASRNRSDRIREATLRVVQKRQFLQKTAGTINSTWKMPPQTPDRQLLKGLDLALTPHHYALIDNWWLFISLDNVLDAWAAVYEDPFGKILHAFASLVLVEVFSRSRKATAAYVPHFGEWLLENCRYAVEIWGELYGTLYEARRDQLLSLRQGRDWLGRVSDGDREQAAEEWKAFQGEVLKDISKEQENWRSVWTPGVRGATELGSLDPTMATVLDFMRLADAPTWDKSRGNSRADVLKGRRQV
ncbi:hypothetical protein JCM5296_002492 [Sporobolomyces johnsonii]